MFPVEDLRGLQYQTVTVGIMPAENVPRVAEALFQIPFILIPLQIQKDRALVLAASSTDNARHPRPGAQERLLRANRAAAGSPGPALRKRSKR